MSDFYATEKIIGGTAFLGVGSLLTWNVSQAGDAGMPRLVFAAVGVFGFVWMMVGLFELVVGRRWHDRSEEIQFIPGEPEQTTL